MDLAELDLWLLNRTSAYDWRYSPDQPRDDHGRFGEGDSGDSGGDSADTSAGKSGPSPISVADLPRTEGKVAATQAAEATNPNFGASLDNPTYRGVDRWTPEMGPPPNGAYEENCTNAVHAFEMRMRGYDVQAAPMDMLDKYGYAAGRTQGEMDRMLADGYRNPDGSAHDRSFASQQWRPLSDIDKEVKAWPENGRGVIHVGRHVFSVVKSGGKAQYVESQIKGARLVTSEYRTRFGAKGSGAKVVRLDDLIPTDGILAAVTSR